MRSLRTRLDHHRERGRPSGFGFAFADRIGYLDSAAWDVVTRDATLFLRRDILGVMSTLDGDAARLHELYLAVHDRASIRLVTLPSTFLPSLSRAAGDAFRCTVIRRNGDVVGFVTTLRDGETAVAYYVGFDRAAADAGLPLYLMLLHATIADAIEWKCTRLSLGRTALEPKAGSSLLLARFRRRQLRHR